MARWNSWRTRACAWISLLALGACANPGAGIEGSDSDASFGSLRASWEVPRPTILQGGPPPRQFLMEVELATSDADFTQSLAPGETTTVDGTSFVGPATLHTDYELHRANLDGRLRLRGEHAFGLDLFGGLGFTRLELDTSAPGSSASLHEEGFGPRLGLGVFYEPLSRWRLFAEGSWQAGFVGGGDVADVQAFDLGMNYRLTDSIEFELAWRRLVYQLENDGANSDLDLTASGPRLGFALRL